MRGYVVIDTTILDEDAFADYRTQIPEALTSHGGRFIVRGGHSETVEGDWTPSRLVIMEFDSHEAARGFIASDEYTSLDELRHRAVRSTVVVVEGYEG